MDMSTTLEAEVAEMHKEIGEIKEALDIMVENYIEIMHEKLEKDKDKFISLDNYRKKHGL